jgi:molybdopterin/thiamine biosynthesis adenylyltransferase
MGTIGVNPMKAGHIIVAGAGGNTGSHLLPLLARMPELTKLTLVDPDFYESANLAAQSIESSDVGKAKVETQAAKLRQIRPDLEVAALRERIEDIPRGVLQCDLLVSCLDSKAARQHVNEIAWRLDTPYVDCGVLGFQNLARVNAYVPSHDSPCLECSWSADEYSRLEQEYLCAPQAGAASPTDSSAALGAMAASLVAIEIGKFRRGESADSLVSRQLIFDAQHHHALITTERRNPWCRFDHQIWHIEPWNCKSGTTTVQTALNDLGSLQVDGHRFISELVCPGCGGRHNAPRLNRPLMRCAKCDRRMASSGFGPLERLDAGSAREFMHLTLAQIGLRAGDIVSSGCRHRLLMEVA